MVPANVTIVTGDQLRVRHATDLRTALALVPGLEAPPGGDTGPAGGYLQSGACMSLTHSFWSSTASLGWRIQSFHSDARSYQRAAHRNFEGCCARDLRSDRFRRGHSGNPLPGRRGSKRSEPRDRHPWFSPGRPHYKPAADRRLGPYPEFRWGKRWFDDKREDITNGHAQYRASMPLGPGQLRFDADLSFVRQVPPSPVIRQGSY